MDTYGWIQLGIFVGLLLVLTKPTGIYLSRVLDPSGTTFLDPLVGPMERIIYRLLRLEPRKEQDWRDYTLSLITFSCTSLLFSYVILRLQHLLPLNPQRLGPVSAPLAFNTAVSFATNTNWQNYGGESTMSYLSQMVALVFHNFVSAAASIAVAAALVRAIARQTAKTIGNFWVDLIRINLYLLLPLSLILAVFLVSQGMIQNFKPYEIIGPLKTSGIEAVARTQTIVQGPMASQVAIKMLGTNGGGYTNANASHPYENPTPLCNFIQILAIFLIPAGLTYYLGIEVKSRKHGWAVFSAMLFLFLVGMVSCWWAESSGNPRLYQLGVAPDQGNMEGKEVRFGVFYSALFATVTTDASCGAVNAMHDSFTPLGGLVPLVNIQLGEVVFGGVGAGLYGMLVFVILAVFLAGLMVGRTPEYLGKKIEAYDVKMCALAVLVMALFILGFTAWASAAGWGLAGLANAGPHGLSEMLYAFSSTTGNNGSAFAGLSGNTPWYNIVLGVAMLFGRFLMIIPVMALAGNLARKKLVPPSGGSVPVWGTTFVVLLVGVVVIVGALAFLPVLALGPIAEHFLMNASRMLY